MRIAPGFETSHWQGLKLDDPESTDWAMAAQIFDARIRGRFLDPVDQLVAAEDHLPREKRRFGFAVMAIECLLVETLHAFVLGLLETRDRSREMFVMFLAYAPSFAPPFTTDLASVFFDDFRNGILHQAEIGRYSRVVSEGPLLELEGTGLVVNRNEFHRRLKTEYEAYLSDLLISKDSELRKNFRTKMSYICRSFGAA